LRGNVDTIILHSLKDGELYGLEIIDRVKVDSNSKYELKKPTLYSALKRLQQNGLVNVRQEPSALGGDRTYYRLTTKGTQHLAGKKFDWMYSRDLINGLLDEEIEYIAKEKAVAQAQVLPMTAQKPAAVAAVNDFFAERATTPAVAASANSNIVVATRSVSPMEAYVATSTPFKIPVEMPFTAPLHKPSAQIAFDFEKLKNTPAPIVAPEIKIQQKPSNLTPFTKHSAKQKSSQFILQNRIRFASAMLVSALVAFALFGTFKTLKTTYSSAETNTFIVACIGVAAYMLGNFVVFSYAPHQKVIATSRNINLAIRGAVSACIAVGTLSINVLCGLSAVTMADFLVYLTVPVILGAVFVLDGLAFSLLRRSSLFHG